LGEHFVPKAALEALADRNIPLAVKGKVTYAEQLTTVRVLIPLQLNDGRDVSPERLTDALLEIVDRFGAPAVLWPHPSRNAM
jgi:hypothetical protein